MPQFNALHATEDGQPVVRLIESSSASEVSIAPGFGANAYDYHVGGKRILFAPNGPGGSRASLAELLAQPKLCGVPFLAPWANRIDGLSYQANGKTYLLNPKLGNLRIGNAGNPIHGLLAFSPDWTVEELASDANAAWVRLQLDFSKKPDWLAQFPFPHHLGITYRLTAGSLEVITSIHNLASAPLPLAIGFHPYFQLSDSPRDEWKVTIPATERLVLNEKLIPTGERQPNPHPDPFLLRGVVLDDVFAGLRRNAQNQSVFRVEGKGQAIEVVYGPEYTIGVVYAPANQSFICFEPMTAPTNAFNTPGSHKTIAPGATWRESFWIRTTGF